MKILPSLLFVALLALLGFLARKHGTWAQEETRGKRRGAMSRYLGLAMLVVSFIQFWLLTGIFSLQIILLLFGASLAGAALNTLIGATTGSTLPEKQKKISALTTIWTAQRPRASCLILAVVLTVTLISVIGSLGTYWSHPIGDPVAIGLIALFQFTIPHLIRSPLLMLMEWPVVTSEFLDDDMRNWYLASGFSNIIYSTIYLLFPVWVFGREFSGALEQLPPVWLLVSMPLIGFLVAGVIPFFVGFNRFRTQSRILLEWRLRWLSDVLKLVKLPKGEIRSEGLDKKYQEIEGELERRLAENKLFQFYRDLMTPAASRSDNLALPSPGQDLTAVTDTGPAAERSAASALPSRVTATRQLLKEAMNILTSSHPSAGDAEQEESPTRIIKENKRQLVEWDIRFAHIYKLLETHQVALKGKIKNIGGYIEVCLAEVERDIASLSQRRNVLAAAMVAVSSLAIVWALNAYEDEIVKLISMLGGSG